MKTALIMRILKAGALLSIIIACGTYSVNQLLNGDSSSSAQKPAQTPETEQVLTADPIHIPNPEDDPMQPKYVPINEKAVLQNVRRKGKTYTSQVIGSVQGTAYKEDWGMGASAAFNYCYGLETTAVITENNGLNIIEERTFNRVIENVTVSNLSVGLNLPMDRLGFLFDALDVSENLRKKVGILNEVRIPIPDKLLGFMRTAKLLPKGIDPQEIADKMTMFTKANGEEMLVNKKVRITFTDGQGVTLIEPMEGCRLSEREIDVIKRSNYVMDYYIMPDRNVEVDNTWSVNGNVFSGLLDPRMIGRVEGHIQMRRAPDFRADDDSLTRKIRIDKGNIQFCSPQDGHQITGGLSGVQGLCLIPVKDEVITKATMSGYAEYHDLSTDHILFGARMSITPRFNITYECKISD